MFNNGPDTGSIESRVMKWTARQCRSRQDWGNLVEDTKLVNANANTGEVTVSGKNVQFSARAAQRYSLAV